MAEDRYSKLDRIAQLKERGILTDQEFELEKQSILSTTDGPSTFAGAEEDNIGEDMALGDDRPSRPNGWLRVGVGLATISCIATVIYFASVGPSEIRSSKTGPEHSWVPGSWALKADGCETDNAYTFLPNGKYSSFGVDGVWKIERNVLSLREVKYWPDVKEPDQNAATLKSYSLKIVSHAKDSFESMTDGDREIWTRCASGAEVLSAHQKQSLADAESSGNVSGHGMNVPPSNEIAPLHFSPEEQKLITEAEVAWSDYRDDPGTGDAANNRHSVALAKLFRRGICWGRVDEPQAAYQFHRCAADSIQTQPSDGQHSD